MKLANIPTFIVIVLLFLSPFLIGWGIFALLNPATYLETLVTLLVVVFICSSEGIFAWIMAIVILLEL